MGWKVGVVLDDEINLASLQILLGQMPVWALKTSERQEALKSLNEEFRLFWLPEPAFTVFTAPMLGNRVNTLLDLIPTIADHHPNLTGLHLVGIETTTELLSGLSGFGYEPVPDPNSVYPDRMRFAMPVSRIANIPEIGLDADGWQSSDDVYDSFFCAVRAPKWHGRNLDALNDSISTGNINEIEVPYRLVVRNVSRSGPEARTMIELFLDVVRRIQTDGCPVSMIVHE